MKSDGIVLQEKLKSRDNILTGDEDGEPTDKNTNGNSLNAAGINIPESGIISIKSTKPKKDKKDTDELFNASRKKGKVDSKNRQEKKRKRHL